MNPRLKIIIREYVEAIVIAFVLAMVIRTFVVQAFKIPSGSMRPTLIERDRILVNKFIYRFKEPQIGDIVVFKYPEDLKKDFIKRFIAGEGQTVQIINGDIWIDGKTVTSPKKIKNIYYYNRGEFGEVDSKVTVPEGLFFVLGDNSASSRDSRYWGFVPRKNLQGKAFFMYWPLHRIGKIE